MKAAFIRDYGKVEEAVEIGDLDRPVPGHGQLLVDVYAAGVNPVDWKIIEGHLRGARPAHFPLIVGNELAGVVIDTAPGVLGWKAGDALYARVGRAFAEFAAVDAALAAPKPETLDFATAAGVPLAAMTAWQGLFEHGGLRQGQKVLVHAGAGGVGSFAIQFAKQVGAQVATTTGPDGIEMARALGADEVIDYRSQRFDELLCDYDLVLDTIGGETQERSVSVLHERGVLVSTVGISVPERPGLRYVAMMMHPEAEQLREIGTLIDQGAVKPQVTRTYPLAEARAALLESRSGHAKGKLVVLMR